MGIYFDCYDKDLNLKNVKRISAIIGIFFLSIIIIRSFILISPLDKYYYLLLPLGISSFSLIGKQFKDIIYFRNIILIAFLLPVRRIFYFLANPLLMLLTKYFTFLVLFSLGLNPILANNSIVFKNSELVISRGCGGADNMYFVIAMMIIYFLSFRLRARSNLIIIFLMTFLVPLIVNIFRNTLLGLIVTLETNRKDIFFYFFHDSYGSLIFSFISVSIVSYIYFKLLNNELGS